MATSTTKNVFELAFKTWVLNIKFDSSLVNTTIPIPSKWITHSSTSRKFYVNYQKSPKVVFGWWQNKKSNILFIYKNDYIRMNVTLNNTKSFFNLKLSDESTIQTISLETIKVNSNDCMFTIRINNNEPTDLFSDENFKFQNTYPVIFFGNTIEKAWFTKNCDADNSNATKTIKTKINK